MELARFTLAAILLALVAASVLSRTPPTWWRSAGATDPRLAEEVENGFWRHATAARPMFVLPGPPPTRASPEWRVSLDEEDACAWLEHRLPLWIANQREPLPGPVGSVRAAFRDGRVLVGVELESGDTRRVLWASVRPALHEDGSLWLPAAAVGVGRLSLPESVVLHDLSDGPRDNLLPDDLGDLPEVGALLAVLRGEKPALIEPSVRLDGGRRVRITDFTLLDGRIEIAARTEVR